MLDLKELSDCEGRVNAFLFFLFPRSSTPLVVRRAYAQGQVKVEDCNYPLTYGFWEAFPQKEGNHGGLQFPWRDMMADEVDIIAL